MMLQGGGGAERLFIGFDFMGRARGRGRLQAGLGGREGVGSQAALCFVAHIAASQQVRCRYVHSISPAVLMSEQHRVLLSAGSFFATDHTVHGGAGIEEIVYLKEALVHEYGLAEATASM